MSDVRRIIPITIDVNTGIPVVSAADRTPVPTYTVLYDGTLTLWCCTLVNSDGTASNPPADVSWLFGLNDDFDHAALVAAQSPAKFNLAGDWDDLAPTAGKICWRADLTTPELANALTGKTSETAMWANLWMGTLDGWDLKCQWRVNVMPVSIKPSSVTPLQGVSHVTSQQAAALYVPIWGDQARWRWRAGGWQYLFEEDSQWREFCPRIIDGLPTMSWSDPVSP